MDLIAAANYAAYIYDVDAAGEGASEEELAAFFAEGGDAGTGPYTISSWEPGSEFELTLDAFPEYWGGWDGEHYEEVVFRVVPEVTTAHAAGQGRRGLDGRAPDARSSSTACAATRTSRSSRRRRCRTW